MAFIELDVNQGLEYCVDEELYKEVLESYLETNNKPILDEYLASGDMANYAVVIHSVKSSSRTIGAECLFERAYALELAAKADDIETVRAGHNDLMADYETILGMVKEYLDNN